MISKSTIKQLAHSRSYQRGLDIYRMDQVLDMDLDEFRDEDGPGWRP